MQGSVSQKERQASIDRFQSGGSAEAFVFLLSTKAGGGGINLTAADTCIIFDSDWNPQNDLQGMARCHRIGQTNEVVIYRLITNGTYEKAMFERARRKLALDAALLGGGADAKTGGGKADAKASAESQPSSADLSALLKQGAYEVLRADKAASEAASAAFAAADIEELLAKGRDVNLGADADDAELLNEDSGAGVGLGLAAGAGAGGLSTSADAGAAPLDADDPDFWLKAVGEGGFKQENLGRGARKRARVSRSTLADVSDSDLADSASSDSGDQASDGGEYIGHELSDAEAELKEKRKNKSKEGKKAEAERKPRKDLVAAAIGRRVECFGTGADRTRVVRGVYTPEGKVLLDETALPLRAEYKAAAAAAEAGAAALAAAAKAVASAPSEPPADPPAIGFSFAWAAASARPLPDYAAADGPVEVSLFEFCAIAGNKHKRAKASVTLIDADDVLLEPPSAKAPRESDGGAEEEEEMMTVQHGSEEAVGPKRALSRPRLISLQMIEDPDGAFAGRYDKFLPPLEKPAKEPKAAREPKAPKEPKGWSKADRDKAVKTISALGVGDVPRLARALNKSDKQVGEFVVGLLARLVGFASAPGAGVAFKDLNEVTITRGFWGLLPDADAGGAGSGETSAEGGADGGEEGGGAVAGSAEGGTVWAMLPADAKFDESLKRNAPTTLQRLAWLKALCGIATQVEASDAPQVDADPAVAAPEENEERKEGEAPAAAAALALAPAVTLALPEAMEKMLGSGATGGGGSKSSGTVPARWWKAEQDRALLEYSAANGLALTDAMWATLAGTPLFSQPRAAAEEAFIASSSSATAAAAAKAVMEVTAKQVITRRDALLKRLQTIQYGKPGPSAAAKRSRFFGASASAPSTAPGSSSSAAAAVEQGEEEEAAGASKLRKLSDGGVGEGGGVSEVMRVESGESTATTATTAATTATASAAAAGCEATEAGAASIDDEPPPPAASALRHRLCAGLDMGSPASQLGSPPSGAGTSAAPPGKRAAAAPPQEQQPRKRSALATTEASAAQPKARAAASDAPAVKAAKAKEAPAAAKPKESAGAKVLNTIKAQPSLMGFFAKKPAPAQAAGGASSSADA